METRTPPPAMSTGSCGHLFYEIREAEDGFSLFTWAWYPATGRIQWREQHALPWQDAFAAALEWIR